MRFMMTGLSAVRARALMVLPVLGLLAGCGEDSPGEQGADNTSAAAFVTVYDTEASPYFYASFYYRADPDGYAFCV